MWSTRSAHYSDREVGGVEYYIGVHVTVTGRWVVWSTRSGRYRDWEVGGVEY